MEEPISKSQKKRDAEHLQQLGVNLIDLTPSKLDLLPLSLELRAAIIAAKTIKSHGAMRRQAQLIGKLMRKADSEAILIAYEKIVAEDGAKTARFHDLEQWRERLITGGKQALADFVELYHPQGIQQLRQLINKAMKEQNNDKHTGASKALFRFLRSCL